MAKKFRTLANREVDSLIRQSQVYYADGWRSNSSTSFDLSRIEYVEYGAVARLLCFVEGALRHGVHIAIELPVTVLRASEARYLESLPPVEPPQPGPREARVVLRRVEDRARARDFMTAIGFDSCLSMAHLPSEARRLLSLREDGVALGDLNGGIARLDRRMVGRRSFRRYPAILPLEWIADSEALVRWSKRAVEYLYKTDMVVSVTDGSDLVHEVVQELVDNVLTHANDGAIHGGPAAIAGAITYNRHRSTYKPNPDHFYGASQEYVSWLARLDTPIGRLTVGDSGTGIVSTLGPRFRDSVRPATSISEFHRGCIRYAFESTLDETGLTGESLSDGIGLNAVRGFTRAYRGLVSLRSDTAIVTLAFNREAEDESADTKLAYVPGTSADVFVGLSLRARETAERASQFRDEEVNFTVVQLDALTPGRLTKAATSSVDARSTRPTIVLLVFPQLPADSEDRRVVARELRSLVDRLSGQAGVAAILPQTTAAAATSSFGSLDEQGGEAAPFLVVPATGDGFWSGGSSYLRELLSRLTQGATESLSTIEEQTLGHRSDMDYVRTQRDWIRSGSDGYCLRLGLGDVDAALGLWIRDRIDGMLEAAR